MILHCSKCKKQLTKDLYYVKKRNTHWIYIDSNGDILKQKIDSYSYYQKYFFEGQFTIENFVRSYNNKWSENHPAQIVKSSPKKITVSENDILDHIIPIFKEGSGCCNWSSGCFLKCSCGHHLGEMYLDCYEPKIICFYDKNVKRQYKN